MARRYTLEEVKDIFKKIGYTPLFTEYKNNSQPLSFECGNKHVHQICLRDLNSGRRCGLCAKNKKSTLEEARQSFLKEGYTPMFDSHVGAHVPVEFKCPKGHLHKISLSSFRRGARCLLCCREGRKVPLSTVQSEFIQAGYKPLFEEYTNSYASLEFICDIGHRNYISFGSFRAGHRCSMCARSERRTPILEAQKAFLDCGYEPLFDKYVNQMEPLFFRCGGGHERYIRLHNLKRGQKCGACQHLGVSRAETEIKDHFTSLSITLEANTKKIIAPLELDLFFPEHALAVEYCGLYWHSEVSGGKNRRYHYHKRKLCEDLNIRLITVFEDEFLNQPEVVLSRIENSLGISKLKVYARKCEVVTIDNKRASLFLETHHLQGKTRAKVHLGLTYNNELIGVMSGGFLSRSHVTKLRSLELKRLCFLPGYSVIGGASKLFARLLSFAESNDFAAIRSYQDMRYGDPVNPVYSHLGFKLVSETKYTPHYLTSDHKLRIRNQVLRKTPEERLTGKTEWELRQEQGYDRIWDCGHRTYELLL